MIAPFVMPAVATGPTVVRASALTKRFGRTVAVSNVELEVSAGECVGLTGPSGGGRTTLLRILATLLPPSSGLVEIAGRDAVRQPADVRAHVVFVGDRPPAVPGLTVREYLEWLRGARANASGRLRPTVDETLARAVTSADTPVDELSRGHRQRVALAGALMLAPDLLLLDDPLQGLDAPGRRLFADWIRDVRDSGVAIVVATSDHEVARGVCSRTARMDEGRLQ